MATKRTKKRKARKAKAFTGFREGSKRALVWRALSRRLTGGKHIRLADIAAACRSALRMSADEAGKQSGLFLWTYVRAGLVKRVGRGEFAAVTQRKEG